MISENGTNHKLNLDPSFFHHLNFDDGSLKQYRIDAAERCADTLGAKPALCFSGGIDSQAMIQCWQEAGLKFDVIIGVFNDNLNVQDSSHAKMYCKINNIPYKELKIDIVTFLTRSNYLTSSVYNSVSPHFNTHYYIVEELSKKGYTGTCFGGVTPFKKDNRYGENFNGAAFHFLKIQNLLPIPMQGSFLSFYPELAWAITINSKELITNLGNSAAETQQWDNIQYLNKLRYEQKVESYMRSGFNIIPQVEKFTGFELVKEYFAKKFNDGWAFEKRFRHPIVKQFGLDKNSYMFDLDFSLIQAIESVCTHNL